MSKDYEVNVFSWGVKGKAYIVFQGGFNNPHKDMWEISFSGKNKQKYYFKSYHAAKLFLEINGRGKKR